MNKLLLALFCVFWTTFLFSQQTYEVNLSGNAYVTSFRDGATITQSGLKKWISEKSVIETFIYFHKPETISISIKGIAESESVIEISFQRKKIKIAVPSGNFEIPVGTFQIRNVGYHPIKLQGINKTGSEFTQIKSFIVRSNEKPTYVHDFSDYWGRRGPSVHFRYAMPKETVEWFYNEIIVPKENDVIGSFYMVNGFGEGYFGMQCNSETERRILFSVWSPFDTQEPKLIPDSLKIKLLRKGEGVYIGEFGNEGSGGQSFLQYNWKAGKTYKFLTQVKPDDKGNTIYTSYFFAADENRWRLIAGFLRPQTNVYYTRAHSFLENFIPEQGYLTRRVLFRNQWFRTSNGEWMEANESVFTYDETARKQARLDYQGGYNKQENAFYLQNCGFFNESTPYKSKFTRKKENKVPNIDFEQLEKL
ncbi:MAG: hypothetical protein BWZ00_01453 [Bacteroidetes bacterium ADurb.BinA174]|nr:MAG: hypothetical protein BWZ00_01453 [Bacteroidetes bacterium ADurb.BinA174]